MAKFFALFWGWADYRRRIGQARRINEATLLEIALCPPPPRRFPPLGAIAYIAAISSLVCLVFHIEPP